MIALDDELTVTLERLDRFQKQVAYLRKTEASPDNYHASASGYLAEISRMQLQVREFFSLHPSELTTGS